MLSRCNSTGSKCGLCCACWLAIKPREALECLLAGRQQKLRLLTGCQAMGPLLCLLADRLCSWLHGLLEANDQRA